MSGPGRRGLLRQSLSTQVLALLTVALLPLGLIAVYQTNSVIREAGELARRDILARTAEAATAEYALMQRAVGAARALGAAALETGPDSAACDALMTTFTGESADFVFAGFIGADGVMACSTGPETVDFSSSPDWLGFAAEPRIGFRFTAEGAVSGRSVIVVSVPVGDAPGDFAGAGTVSVPHSLADTLLRGRIDEVDLAIVNAAGEVLSASGATYSAGDLAPLGLVPGDIAFDSGGVAIETTTPDGDPVTVAVVELADTGLYALGTWSRGVQPLSVSFFGTTAPAFPVIMWLLGLFVAFFAVNRLVLRPLGRLRTRMASFSVDTPGAVSRVHLGVASAEFRDIERSYNAMVDRIRASTAELEATVHEKDVLLKEVHHRVKNNLQLIASILNMQLRTLHSPEAERVLRRVQDRVMSLALIHKSLYSDAKVETVRVDRLLREITSGIISFGKDTGAPFDSAVDLAPVALDPDQAVPLSLLATEAVTNAVKYAGAPPGETARIRVALSEDAGGRVVFTVVNSRGERPNGGQGETDGSGLGTRLIEAFVDQLGGILEVDEGPASHALRVEFGKLVAQPAAT